MNHCRPI